jgi:hypothetical protein
VDVSCRGPPPRWPWDSASSRANPSSRRTLSLRLGPRHDSDEC